MSVGRSLPLRPFALLGAAVLAAHWLLLMAATGSLHIADTVRVRPLVTRTIQSQSPPAAALPGQQPAVVAIAAPPPTRIRQDTPPALAPTVTSPLANAEVPTAVTPPQPPPSDTTVAEATRPPREAIGQPVSFAVPDSVKLVYDVTAHSRQVDWHAKAELVWKHDAEFYEATLELSAPLFPSRKQRSTGRITEQGLAPSRFSDKTRSEEAAHFERDKGRITFSTNQPEAPLLAGAQDRLSILIQLAAMIGSAPQRFPPATTIEIQTASTRDAQVWLFTVAELEQLNLPGGKLAALKLIRNPRREFDQKVELWLAPGMDYAPVRLRLTQPNGDWVDQQWSLTDRA
jgi:hypothetical protein